jgi:hypothetical protein
MQMAAKKPGRAEDRGAAEATESAPEGTASEGAQSPRGRRGGSPARKSQHAASDTGAGAQGTGTGGEAAGDTAPAGGTGGDTQAPTRAPRKRSAATADSGTDAGGGATRGRKTAGAGATKAAKSAKPAKTARGGGGARKSRGPTEEGASGGGGGDLQGNLRAFVQHHPHGWEHRDWEGLLHHLRGSGIDTSDTAGIGSQLEKARLTHALENSGVSGLGTSKLRSLVDRFGSVWQLREASVDDIAGVKGIDRSQAEQIRKALR